MSTAVVDSCLRVLSLSWLTGPVFGKELRVSSRRRRNHFLRWVYIVGFTVLIALIWNSVVPSDSSGVNQAARMSRAGTEIIQFVVWFQFVAAQVLAVVMLSTAISDEIYHRTLGLLMTTPINSLQIVLGKLLSKLLQLMLLVAISLPMLAIVRVFGGVPWKYVVFGLCVTLTTAIFYGSLSLFFSIFTKRAYLVIIQTVLTGVVLFGVLPVLAVLSLRRIVPDSVFARGLFYLNPYYSLAWGDTWLTPPGPPYSVMWPIHCGVALGCSTLILLLATIFVRKAALRQVMGQRGTVSRRQKKKTVTDAPRGHIRRVVGSPVLWKEWRIPLIGRWTVGRFVMVLVVGGLLLLAYVLCAAQGILRLQEVQMTYILVYVLIGMLVTSILPATCITVEKESQAWPILLTTAVSNGAIIRGKLLGVLPRCLLGWAPLFGHLAVSSAIGYIHPVAIVQFAIVVASVTLFLCGTGLYFGTRIKHTTSAVIANVALAAGLWLVAPLVIALLSVAAGGNGDLAETCLDTNPAIHAVVIGAATSKRGDLRYEWIQQGTMGPGPATSWMLINLLCYAGISVAFLVRAWQRVRRKPV